MPWIRRERSPRTPDNRSRALSSEPSRDAVLSPGGRLPRILAHGLSTWTNPVCSESPWRSEEHTSELQSQSNLVCRLLLEKKKKKKKKIYNTYKIKKHLIHIQTTTYA